MVVSYAQSVYRFGIFEAEVTSGELRKAGIALHLQPQPSLVLLMLLRHAGEMVTREQLRKSIWPNNTFVEFDDGLNHAIRRLREALGDSAHSPVFIETIPRRGYRFVAPVEMIQGGPQEASLTQTNLQLHQDLPTKRESGRSTAQKWLLVSALLAIAVFGTATLLWYRRSVTRSLPRTSAPTVTRLTNRGSVEHAAISPDGKYLAFIEREGLNQSLWLQQVATTVSMRILDPEVATYESLTFSPDGNYLYYSRGEPDPQSSSKTQRVASALSLYRLAMLGGSPWKLLADAPARFGISPDGKSLAYIRRDPATHDSAVLVAAIDSSGQKTIANRSGEVCFGTQGISWSPRGELLAVVEVTLTPAPQYALLVLPLNGGPEKMRVPLPARLLQPQWLADGSALIAPVGSGHLLLWEISYPRGRTRAITQDDASYLEISLSASNEIVAVEAHEPSTTSPLLAADDADRTRFPSSSGGQVGVAPDKAVSDAVLITNFR